MIAGIFLLGFIFRKSELNCSPFFKFINMKVFILSFKSFSLVFFYKMYEMYDLKQENWL